MVGVALMLKSGDKIYYEDKEYLILAVYNSGFLEIQDIQNLYVVRLINRTDIERIKRNILN